MTDNEMSMDEILSSIRQQLTSEVKKAPTEPQKDDFFLLTPEMRCDTPRDVRERMKRVLQKMSYQETVIKTNIAQNELYPLLKEWLIQMRPDLTQEQIQTELHKIIPNL